MTSEDIKELICEDDELACKKLLLYLHSNINLCLDEDGIEAGKDKNCRFNFFIKDENEIPWIHIVSEEKSVYMKRGFDKEISVSSQYIKDILGGRK